ncbi:MAG: hypothetical protein DRP25_08060 [Thermotoga sp.]|nr:MAG: hypothetical protein DRP25_08060 [Thermotoga sp.]
MLEINGERYLTRDDLQKLFGVSHMTILRWEKKGILKRIKIPGIRRVYYKEADIKKLLEKYHK